MWALALLLAALVTVGLATPALGGARLDPDAVNATEQANLTNLLNATFGNATVLNTSAGNVTLPTNTTPSPPGAAVPRSVALDQVVPAVPHVSETSPGEVVEPPSGPAPGGGPALAPGTEAPRASSPPTIEPAPVPTSGPSPYPGPPDPKATPPAPPSHPRERLTLDAPEVPGTLVAVRGPPPAPLAAARGLLVERVQPGAGNSAAGGEVSGPFPAHSLPLAPHAKTRTGPAAGEPAGTSEGPEEAPRTLGARAGVSAGASEGPGPRAVLVAVLGGFALGFPLVRLYRRIDRTAVLEHPVRREIHELVAGSPGLTPAEIGRATGLHYTTCVHHLRVLEDCDEVEVRRMDGRVRCFLNHGRFRALDRAVVAAWRSTTPRAIVGAVLRKPGLTPSELARRLGLHRATVTEHVDRLVEAGVLEEERAGRARRLSAAPGVLDSLLDLAGGSVSPRPHGARHAARTG